MRRSYPAIGASLADPRLKQRIAEPGDTVFLSSPSEFRKCTVDYLDKWAR
jgi:hypothetical protein